MTRRRTKQQKIVAKLRRELSSKENGSYSNIEAKSEDKVDVKPIYYQPELSLPTRLVWLDLTKTIAVAILALALQIGLSIWMSKGGWQWINSVWFAKLIK